MTATKEWNARSYHEVSAPQFTWGTKVLGSMELAGSERALDAGCGTGRLTKELLDRLPRGSVVAADRSENMIAEARVTLATAGDRASFWCGDLLELPFRSAFDLVFSTATFHWILDHEALFAVLLSALAPGGKLVAQCGGAGNLERVHERAAALMARPPYAPHFEGWGRIWEFASDTTTRARLDAAGFVDVETNLEQAPTPFPDAPALETFLETVVLRNHLARLPNEELRRAFLGEIVAKSAGDDPPYCLDYVRLNLRAARPDI